jgi:hypothetical protein
MCQTITCPIADIKIGNRYRVDLGDLNPLIKSIKRLGLLQPIAADINKNLIFGLRRLHACRLAGLEKIECRILNTDHLLEMENDENDDDLRKSFTISEKVAIAKALKEKVGDQRETREKQPHVANLPHASGERSRDIIAEKSGLGSATTMRNATTVVDQGPPELKEAMDAGTVSPSDGAWAVKNLDTDTIGLCLALVLTGKCKTMQEAAAKAKPAAEPEIALDSGRAGTPKVYCPHCTTLLRKNLPATKRCPECKKLRKPNDLADEPRLLDKEGHKIPPTLADAFSSLNKFEELDQLCRRLQKRVDELARLPGGEQLAKQLQTTAHNDKAKRIMKSDHLEALKRDLHFTRPHSVCPWCEGKAKKDCKGCLGTGWVAKITWQSAGADVKERLL